MKQKARHFLNLLLGALLSLLGFASCDGILGDLRTRGGGKNGGGMVCMYGSPTVNWHASGRVTDASGKGIEGIRVAIRAHKYMANTPGVIYDQNDWYYDDTLYTDANGNYKLEKHLTSFSAPDDATVVFEDVDGLSNGGLFESQTLTPKIEQVKKGDGAWYNGDYAIEANAKLTKKQ